MEWISVEDRLPESDKDVLVWHKNDTILIGQIKSYTDDTSQWRYWWEGHRYSSCLRDGYIAYWMPLPEPPKQETITVVVHIDPWAGKTLTPDEFEERVRDAVKRAIYP